MAETRCQAPGFPITLRMGPTSILGEEGEGSTNALQELLSALEKGAQYIDEEETTLIYVPRPRAPVVRPLESILDRLWDANDVARYLKVSRSWVYHRAEAGLLPVRRVGALLRFDPAAIRAFAAGKPPEDTGRPQARPRAEGIARNRDLLSGSC
jgi:Helix-turn-helix domain